MFLPLDIPFEYWIKRVILGTLYVMFIFSTRISSRRVSGFATDRPCGVCLLYVGPLCGNHVWNDIGFMSQIVLYCFHNTLVLLPYTDVVLTFSIQQCSFEKKTSNMYSAFCLGLNVSTSALAPQCILRIMHALRTLPCFVVFSWLWLPRCHKFLWLVWWECIHNSITQSNTACIS